jgi:hypothetical protein
MEAFFLFLFFWMPSLNSTVVVLFLAEEVDVAVTLSILTIEI